jgi:hypothetical protein
MTLETFIVAHTDTSSESSLAWVLPQIYVHIALHIPLILFFHFLLPASSCFSSLIKQYTVQRVVFFRMVDRTIFNLAIYMRLRLVR